MPEIAQLPFDDSENPMSITTTPNDHLDRVALTPFTSGTTGMPKAVPRTVKNMCAGAASIVAGTRNTHDAVHPPVGLILGSSFASMTSTIAYSYWYMGGTAVIADERFSRAATLRVIETCRVSILAVMRSHIALLCEGRDLSPERVKSVKYVVVTGEIIIASFLKKAQEAFPSAVVSGTYRMTEGNGLFGWEHGQPNPVPTWGDVVSCGRSMAATRMRLVSREAGTVVKRGEQGELHAGSDSFVDRYVDKSDPKSETGAFYEDTHGKRWFRTGDIAILDDADNAFVVGRASETVKSLTGSFLSFIVESCIAMYLDVEVHVIGIPSPMHGELLYAIIDYLGEDNATGVRPRRHHQLGAVGVGDVAHDCHGEDGQNLSSKLDDGISAKQ
ncbi:hypothetical protein B0T17DRAFT_507979 [Bombardia bombarda]|uniref:AMP-dependent synthetase/ligase domain-containing protein n=1 Tax=Bombardia bombarda TaxID=252184 RepID=A0AA40C4C8_9PEZI|nr:hypothetical protein B0T17DRAFT_507979 [Bombardia bombarda]